MSQAAAKSFGSPTRPASWDEHEAYFLAGWPCEQGLRTILPSLGTAIVIDIGTGGGVFGQRTRLICPQAFIVGAEIRTDEDYASRHYDQWFQADVFKVERELADSRPDLVTSNPAFTHTLAKLQLALRIVRPGGFVLFLVRADWGHSAESWDFLHSCPPLLEMQIGGRPQFLSGKKPNGDDYGTDWAGAKWLLWRKGHASPRGEWRTRQLPRLPGASLEWCERPGTELHPSPLPAAFWPPSALGGCP